MKKIFRIICIPIMLINNNVYTFVSGIVLSIGTGILTTLCLEKEDFVTNLHLYISVILFVISGGLLIYIATKITSYQNYILTNQILDKNEKSLIIEDFELSKATKWFVLYLILFVTLITGFILMIINYII